MMPPILYYGCLQKEEPEGPDGQIGVFSSAGDARFFETNVGLPKRPISENITSQMRRGHLPHFAAPVPRELLVYVQDSLDKPKIDPNYLATNVMSIG
jgi:hypothetical protein